MKHGEDLPAVYIGERKDDVAFVSRFVDSRVTLTAELSTLVPLDNPDPRIRQSIHAVSHLLRLLRFNFR